jgi:predicted enzyme related to lactoylglutathione lyase
MAAKRKNPRKTRTPRKPAAKTAKRVAPRRGPRRAEPAGWRGDRTRASVTPLVRVTGIGGMFFKSNDPKKLTDWYHKHLGIEVDTYGGWSFRWREMRRTQRIGCTVWSPFEQSSNYFDPSEQPYMFNFRVADLKALLAQLRREGVHVIDEVQEYPYGKFGWIIDPEGRKIELWEPPDVDDPFANPKEETKRT